MKEKKMGNPQPNNFTRFSNELLEKYIEKSRFLSPYENSVWLCVLRKTYGFNKHEDWISLSQVEKMTGIRQPHVVRTKKKLLLKNMIKQNGIKIGIQKDYDRWIIPERVYLNRYGGIPKQAIPKQVTGYTQTGNWDIPKQVDTKETLTKETLTKETLTKERKTPAKAGTPQAELVESWKALYNSETGKTYKAGDKDYVLMANLLKVASFAEVVDKSKLLFNLCKNCSAWFTQGGLADFTIGKLSSRWNEIIEGVDANGKQCGISKAELDHFMQGRE